MPDLMITEVTDLDELKGQLKQAPDVVVIGPEFKDDDGRDSAPYLLSPENLYDPQDGSSERWFKHVQYPYNHYECRSNGNAFLRDFYSRIAGGKAAVFVLDPDDPGNLNLCLDLLAAQRVLKLQEEFAGDNSDLAYTSSEKAAAHGRHEMVAPTLVGLSREKLHCLRSPNNNTASLRWTCVWALTMDPLIEELDREAENVIQALAQTGDNYQDMAEKIFHDKFWDLNHIGTPENPVEYFKERVHKLRSLAEQHIPDYSASNRENDSDTDIVVPDELYREKNKFLDKIHEDFAEWSHILKMPSDAMHVPLQAEQSIEQAGCRIIDTDTAGWPIAFTLPVGNGSITVLPPYTQTSSLLKDLKSHSEKTHARMGSDMVEEYFHNLGQEPSVQPSTKISDAEEITVTIEKGSICAEEKYDNRNKKIAVSVQKEGRVLPAKDGNETRLTPQALLRFCHFYCVSRMSSGGALAYKANQGQPQWYAPPSTGSGEGKVIQVEAGDLWPEDISTVLNKIAGRLGLYNGEFKKLPQIDSPNNKSQKYTIRRLADNVTVLFDPDHKTVLSEIKNRTAGKDITPAWFDQIEKLLDRLPQ